MSFFITSCFLLLSITLCTSERIITKMIYHGSIQSPFYNASETAEEFTRREMDMFDAHIHHLLQSQSQVKDDYYQTQGIEAAVISRKDTSKLFMVKLQIRDEDPIPQLHNLDTGSSLLWVRNDRSTYDLTKSYTYKEVECGSTACESYSEEECFGATCAYYVGYMSGYSEGILATETFKFSTERTESVISEVVFGLASYKTDGLISSGLDGMMGLGPKPESLLRQKGYSQFSYCIGNLSDPNYTENVLILNDDSLVDSQQTILIITRKNHYAAILKQISVGGKVLDIVMPQDDRGLATFDTGSSVSILTEPAYLQVVDAVIRTIGNHLKRSNNSADLICYEGDLERDLSWFPMVAFHFAQGAVMEFSYDNLFRQYKPEVICLGMENASKRGFTGSLIGVNLQKYFYVYYNINRRHIRMERMDCESIYD